MIFTPWLAGALLIFIALVWREWFALRRGTREAEERWSVVMEVGRTRLSTVEAAMEEGVGAPEMTACLEELLKEIAGLSSQIEMSKAQRMLSLEIEQVFEIWERAGRAVTRTDLFVQQQQFGEVCASFNDAVARGHARRSRLTAKLLMGFFRPPLMAEVVPLEAEERMPINRISFGETQSSSEIASS